MKRQIFDETIMANLYYLALFSYGVTLLLPENYRNSIIIFFALLIVLLTIKKKDILKSLNKSVLINCAPFLLLAISLLYTAEFNVGIKKVIVLLAMLVFPLGFCLKEAYGIKESEKTTYRFYLIFYVSSILFLIGVFVHNYFNEFLNETIFRHYSERINSKYGKYSMHPIYISMYIGVSLILSTRIYSKLKSRLKKLILILFNGLLVLILVVLARKGLIAVMLVFFTVYFLKNQKPKAILIYFSVVATLFVFSFLIQPVKERYIELFDSIVNTGNSDIGSTTYRINIYQCTTDRIKSAPIFGYGVGDTKNVLKECYEQNSAVFKGLYFNSHNQYLGFWLASGFFGFLSLIIMSIYNLRHAIKTKSFVYISILILFFSVMLTENILERQNGVILFAFFVNFFASQHGLYSPKSIELS